MSLEFHPSVQTDFNAAVAYYEDNAGDYVAERFEAEVRAALAEIATTPRRFPFYGSNREFRRIRLRLFPYVIVYRELPSGVRVTILKHERQRTSFGMRRR